MMNVRTIVGGRRTTALKNFLKRDGLRVKCLGTGATNAKDRVSPGSRIAISEPSRVNDSASEVLCRGRSWKRTLLFEKEDSHHRSGSNSNAKETNLLVEEGNRTGGDEWGGPEAERLIIKLGDNVDESIKTYESLLVYFYTLWCKHCKKLKPVYGAAAVKMKEENVSGHLASIDLTKRMDVADKFNIVSVPIMYYFKKGKFMKVYDGRRTAEDIVNFMRAPPDKPSVPSKIDI